MSKGIPGTRVQVLFSSVYFQCSNLPTTHTGMPQVSAGIYNEVESQILCYLQGNAQNYPPCQALQNLWNHVSTNSTRSKILYEGL